jgi:hypothetical protein
MSRDERLAVIAIAVSCVALAVNACAFSRAHAQTADLRAWAPTIEAVQRETNRAHTYVACNADGRPCFDCVDFAVAKIVALRERGVPVSAIHFVEVLNRAGQRHAAVAVTGAYDGMPKALVLDHTMEWVEPMAAYRQAITSIILIHGGR